MADLSSIERLKLEKLFHMGGGYVLKFSDRTFGEFMTEHSGVNVYASGYDHGGTSKANRLRLFWRREPNHIVGRLIAAMIDYGVETETIRPAEFQDEAVRLEECRRISARLTQAGDVIGSAALTSPSDDRDFEVVANQVQAAIDQNQPEAGLDRLHTFVTKFVRSLCAARGVETPRDKPLHSMMGEYVKALRAARLIESAMTERILKSSISILEAFNDVRNEQSLAHDNRVLNYDESLLIFSHVASSVRFLKALEARLTTPPLPPSAAGDGIPF